MAFPCYSQTSTGAFLQDTVGARPLGLGKAYVAVADDANAPFYNPAGLVKVRSRQVLTSYSEMFTLDVKHQTLSFVQPLPKERGVAALSYVSLSTDGIPQTTAGFNTPGDPDFNRIVSFFSDKETAYILTYARKIMPKFNAGMNLKFIKHKLFTADADGTGVDLGAQFQWKENVRFGMSLLNAPSGTRLSWSTGAKDKMPFTFKLGVLYTLSMGQFGGGGLSTFQKGENNFLGTLEFSKARGEGTDWHAGIEYWIGKSLALRAGHDSEDFSLGLGLHFQKVGFDYAFQNHTLGNLSRFSVRYNF